MSKYLSNVWDSLEHIKYNSIMYGGTEVTQDREKKLLELKRNISKRYGNTFVEIASLQTPLQVVKKSDSEEVRNRKNEQNKAILTMREEEYAKREDEIICELEKIMDRVKATCPDTVGLQEFYSQSSNAALLVQKFYCDQCGNKDPNNTVSDDLRGDTICTGIDGKGCGAIIADRMIHRGSEKRNFEDEPERNHHGPAPNKMMPDVVNMETSLDIPMKGKGRDSFKSLQYAHQSAEMNLSKLENDQKHTREGFKTKMKREAFKKLEEYGVNLNVHPAVVNSAKEIFAWYREKKEAVHDYEGTVIACLVIAFESLSQTMKIDPIKTFHNFSSSSAPVDVDSLVPPKPPASDDPIISLFSTIPLGKFSETQLKDWLSEVMKRLSQTHPAFQTKCDLANKHFLDRSLQPFQDLVLHTIEERIKKESEGSSTGGGDSSSAGKGGEVTAGGGIFACTTISHRQRHYDKLIKGEGEESEEDRYGKYLFSVNWNAIFKAQHHPTHNHYSSSAASGSVDNERMQAFTNEEMDMVMKSLHEAIERRSQADKQYQLQLEAFRSQRNRLMVEKSAKRKLDALNSTASEDSQLLAKKSRDKEREREKEKAKDSVQEEMVILADNIDLEELFGGPVVTVKKPISTLSEAMDSTASVAVKAEPGTEVTVKKEPVTVKKEAGSVGGAAATEETKKTVSRPRPRVVFK